MGKKTQITEVILNDYVAKLYSTSESLTSSDDTPFLNSCEATNTVSSLFVDDIQRIAITLRVGVSDILPFQ